METKGKLIIIRGIPGAGKSTMAREMLAKGEVDYHFEADQYFINDNGDYVFNPQKIGNAHLWCQESTRVALCRNHNVVVANTFTTTKEIKPYYQMAKDLGVTFEVLTATGNYGSIHGVPEDVLNAMRARWQDTATVYKNLQQSNKFAV